MDVSAIVKLVGGLEQLAWADSALHHAAGVARSLHGEAEE
jgi:hypothetical protein